MPQYDSPAVLSRMRTLHMHGNEAVSTGMVDVHKYRLGGEGGLESKELSDL